MLYGDDYQRQSDLWMIPVCSLLLAFGVFSTLDLYPSSLAVEKFSKFLFIITLNFRVNFVILASQSGDGSQEDLAEFGYQLNIESKFFKMCFYSFGYQYFKCVQNSVDFA